MRKIIFSGILLVSLLVFVIPVSAKVDGAPGPMCSCSWYLSGNYVIDFTLNDDGVYSHTMAIESMDKDTGAFSGTGYYNANSSYTWNVTGDITDSAIDFTIVYTGANAGYVVNAVGTIDSKGFLSGTATGPGQSFTWEATSGVAKKDAMMCNNHGQYFGWNKRGPFFFRIGMLFHNMWHIK